jgi:hypothetical protein
MFPQVIFGRYRFKKFSFFGSLDVSGHHKDPKTDGQSKWRFWEGFDREPTMEDLEQIARRIEAIIDRAQIAVIKLADIKSGEVLETFFDVQSAMLRFDELGREQFRHLLEEKRVKTLAHESLVMTGVMSSAVALTVFKNQPKTVSDAPLERILVRVRKGSTHPLTLITFAIASLYAVIGRGALRQVSRLNSHRSIKIKSTKEPDT